MCADTIYVFGPRVETPYERFAPGRYHMVLEIVYSPLGYYNNLGFCIYGKAVFWAASLPPRQEKGRAFAMFLGRPKIEHHWAVVRKKKKMLRQKMNMTKQKNWQIQNEKKN